MKIIKHGNVGFALRSNPTYACYACSSMEFIMVNFEDIKKLADKNTFIGFIFGIAIGMAIAWIVIQFLYDKNEKSYTNAKEILTHQIKDLQAEKNKLDETKSNLEKNLATCQTEKTGLTNSIQQSYVTREEFNRCIQANSQIMEQNKRFNSKQVNDCLNNRQKWQRDLDIINEELRTGETSFGLIKLLTEQQISDRRLQQQQLWDSLKNTNCN